MSKRLQWKGELFAYRLFEKVLATARIETVFRLGEILGILGYRMMGKRRAIVERNLRIAFAGEMGHRQIQELTAAIFERTGANLLCSVRTSLLPREKLADHLEVAGEDLLIEAVDEKRGIVLLIPHMGNWEIIAQAPALMPFALKSGTFYRPLNNLYLNELIVRRRRRMGTRLFSKKNGFKELVQFVRQGGLIGILADQHTGKLGVSAPYFGRMTSCSPLPSIISKRAQAAVYNLTLQTTGLGKWLLRIRTARGPEVHDGLADLEDSLRGGGADVFWFQDRWKLSPGHGLEWPTHKRPRQETLQQSTKPLRVLFLLHQPVTWKSQWPEHLRPDVQLELSAPKGFTGRPPGGREWILRWPTPPNFASQQEWIEAISYGHALPLDLLVIQQGAIQAHALAALKKLLHRRAIAMHPIEDFMERAS